MSKRNSIVPPGGSLKTELTVNLLFALLIIGGISLSFWVVYGANYNNLFTFVSGKRCIMVGSIMPGLNTLMRGKFIGFWGYVVVCVVNGVTHYLSFYTPTKSIYVMKRIPNGRELHFRCLAVPLLSLLGGIILTAILMAFYTFCYWHATPAECLPAFEKLDVWRALL